MELKQRYIHEDDIPIEVFGNRWGKDLIGTPAIPTTSGFVIGVAEFSSTEFGELQVHEDQEAIYVLSGHGEYYLDGKTFYVKPGHAIYVPPKTSHSLRSLGATPVKVLYAHGAI